MIEVRLFAGLRQGRGKIIHVEPEGVRCVSDVVERLDIRREAVNILLINGFHQKPETAVGGG